MTTRIIHVVANEGNRGGGGGFQWFFTKKDADQDFQQTAINAPDDTTVYQNSLEIPYTFNHDYQTTTKR